MTKRHKVSNIVPYAVAILFTLRKVQSVVEHEELLDFIIQNAGGPLWNCTILLVDRAPPERRNWFQHIMEM